MTFAEYLSGLDTPTLTALLDRRPDVLVEPVPRSFRELAQRLDATASLDTALDEVDGDEVVVLREVALGGSTLGELAASCAAPADAVREVLDRLCGRGLAWRRAHRVGLPDRLGHLLAADLLGFPPAARLTGRMVVDDLRTAVAGLGDDPAGLRKVELVARLDALYADPVRVTRALAGLHERARAHLDLLRAATGFVLDHPGAHGGPTATLARAGLVLPGGYGSPSVPREVVVALLREHTTGGLPGRPALPDAAGPADDGRAGTQAALLALTTLLDEAGHRPLAALKKGGVGARELARLAAKVGVGEPAFWIDVAAAAGLLVRTAAGYAAPADYTAWREEPAARRWAVAALAWHALDLAPTARRTDDGEVPPPEPLESAAGVVRRALLRAAAGGRSVAAAAREIGWFCPLHPYTAAALDRTVAAARDEATLLGVVVGDRLSPVGEHLVAAAPRPDAVDALAAACADLLAEPRSLLVLQSDLTAVVSGQPSARAARLLATAAVAERHGAATTWRFSPASVRAALDAGETAESLTTALTEVSDHPLPQPLAYLVADVARRHGAVRVRGARCCLTGTEAETAEILATRSLVTLHLSRVAPTVLVSPFEPDDVLARLRKAGFAPMPEDASGTVILPGAADDPAPARRTGPRPRRRVAAARLAARLRAGGQAPASPSQVHLAGLAPQLDEAEVALLADALDRGADVRIAYRNRAGNRSVRTIRPDDLYDRWISSWCHLRGAQREFAVSGIESVAPAG